MPTGSQYGIDVGNILSTESAIKTARLNRKSRELKMEKEEAGTLLRKNVLDIGQNLLQSKEAMIAEGIEGPAPKPLETLSQEEVNRLSSIAPIVAGDIEKAEKVKQRESSLTKYFESKGVPKEEAVLRASGYNKEIDTFNKEFQAKDKVTQQNIKNNLAQQGQAIQTVLETSAQNPQAANKMFTDYRADTNEQIKSLLREGKTKEADALQSSLDKIPSSLIKTDGSFDTEFLMLSLSKISTSLTDAESWEKQQTAETIQENKLAIEREKAKTPKKQTKREFQQLMAELDKETDPAKRKMIEARLATLSQPKMKALGDDIRVITEKRNTFASKMGLKDPYELSTVDTREWTPEQRAEGNDVASIIIRGLKANAKQVEKKMGEYGAMAGQMQNAIDAYQDVGQFRAADEATKKYFSNYFGLSEDELKSTEAAQSFQSMMNIKIKADSGSAVSGQEMVRNVLETASTFMTKERILMGIRNVAKRYSGELKALKKVMGPVAFNLKYGTTLKNYEEIANATKDSEVKKGDKLSELRKTKKVPRQTLYNQIKAQRPNATDAQINAYLTKKGY